MYKNIVKKVIITGGAGFIGSYLAEYLIKKKNYSITIVDNLENGSIKNIKDIANKVKFIKADISKKGNWDKIFKNTHTVFHLAALSDIVPSIENPEKYFAANVQGTLNILSVVKKYNIKKLVYSASSSCYGLNKNYPTKETTVSKPVYPYALTKKIGEDLVMHWSKIYNINCTSLRLFNVYGPRVRNLNSYGAMFGVFLSQKLANKPLTVVGNGKQSRDFTYVTDVCEAFYKVSINKKTFGEIYNVGTGKSVTINKIVDLLNSKSIHLPKRPGEPDKTHADVSKIKKEIKWKPKISIEDGVNIMLKNISYWKNAPVWNKKSIKNQTKSWFKFLS